MVSGKRSVLEAAARDRLDVFAAAFERISARDYALFATTPADGSTLALARAAAETALSDAGLLEAALDAAAAFVDWAAQAYSRRLTMTDTLMLYESLPDRPEDRVRFARALEAAVLGLIAWDSIAADELHALIGPFAEMAGAE